MKKRKFYKRKSFFVLTTLFLLLVIWIVVSVTRKEVPEYETIIAKKGELVQEVSVTGKVKPIEDADLSFEVSGRVTEILVKVNDKVKVGDPLIRLNNADLVAQLRQAQASVSSAKASLQQYEAAVKTQEAKLDELKRGTRPEEIQIAETTVDNAEKMLEDAKENLENTEKSAMANLRDVYNGTLTALGTAITTGRNALFTLTDIQYSHFTTSTQESHNIEQAKATAMQAMFDVNSAGRWSRQNISEQTGGVYQLVQDAVLDPVYEKINQALNETLNALLAIKIALDTVPIKDDFSTTEISNLDSAKSNINTEITTLSGKRQLILVQQSTNDSAISTAKTEVNNAENTLKSAQDQLKLKKAGYTAEQIKAQEAIVDQAKANLSAQKAAVSRAWATVQQYQAQIDKTILKSPIDGVVTRVETEVGEIVFPSSSTYEVQVPAISIISGNDFQIEANVAEVDISKITFNDPGRVTLDAYGDEVEFQAEVIDIAPTETMVEGVATYEVTLRFVEKDERIKSGMTANVDILTAKLDDVIIIPQRAVISRDGDKIVRVLEKDGSNKLPMLKEIEVKTGLRSSDGQIEILEGIEEGDEVVIMIKDNEK